MRLGATTSEGVLYVTSNAPTASDPRNGGVCMTVNGAAIVNAGSPQLFNQGKAFMNDGALCVDVAGSAIVEYINGLPVTATGALRCQQNQTPASTDPYVGGMRVGPTGGLYVTNVAAPTTPINTVLPAVTGVPSSSNKLTCDGGTWTGQTSIRFQWLRDNVPIIGETGSQLTIISPWIGDTIVCAVIASNAAGDTVAFSNAAIVIALQTVGPDLDGDGVPDTVLFDNGTVMVTEDDDTINIDVNHDGIADIIIPNEVTIIP